MYQFEKNTMHRIDNFMGRLVHKYYKVIGDLNCTAYITREPVRYEDRFTGEKKDLKAGDHWGDLFDCAWMHFTGEIPAESQGENLVLLIDVSGEGLCYDEKRGPLTGLTHGSVVHEFGSVRKHVVPLDLLGTKDGRIDLWVDAGCNDLFGNYVDSGDLKEAFVAVLYPELRAFYYDFYTLREAFHCMEEGPRRSSIIRALNDSINVFYDDTEEEAKHARKILEKELAKVGGTPSLTVNFIGNAHIDLAWLWPIRETIRKGARTLSTVDQLMDRYEDYVFGVSQPQLLLWMKMYYPQLFERIKQRVKEGRIEPQGGMWVEADTNLPGGESLVRQILFGTEFWKREFDAEVDNVWLPDCFGFTASLPQIMRKSGLKYFMTQKMSWNDHNTFPYHTFRWKGLDGSVVLAHMLPEETYNSQASPASVRKIEKNYHEKGLCDQALALFGVGDGGGGPSAYHLEKLKRMKNLEGLSPTVQRFARDFFHDIDRNTEEYPEWRGGLYLEKHRGTFTTQARNKKYNRYMENALHDLEFAAVLAEQYGGKEYPREEIADIWKEVLLYQFHDIIPGSAIKRVYDESVPRYRILYDKTLKMIRELYEDLFAGELAVNTQGFDRTEYLKKDNGWYQVTVPAFAATGQFDKAERSTALEAEDLRIENENLSVRFGRDGSIVSIFDRQNGVEVLPDGQVANRLAVYNEEDGNAWDIEVYYDEQKPRAFELVEQKASLDGVNAVMQQHYRFGDSDLQQTIYLQQDSRLLQFDTKVDWHEKQKMLRTSFPVVIDAEEVTCDIQFGNIRYSTNRNTTWQRSRFERCAHKWVDLSREDYGVALLNDCKYGHKLYDNVLDLALLRSTNSPGKDADQGKHTFRYALYPHVGNEHKALVEQTALAFNNPLKVYRGTGILRPEESFIKVDQDNVILSTVKKAEEHDGIVVRMYETYGECTDCCITLPEGVEKVTLCNLMEKPEQTLLPEGRRLHLHMNPYEITTFIMDMAGK